MTSRIACVVLMAIPVALAGCASMDERQSRHTPASSTTPSLLQEDEAYVAYVERVARRRGIHVTWVNKPRKRVGSTVQEAPR